ncbi:aminoglycoside phosphotransferase [Bosea sp. WAO]|uniref:phosphotransferase n=1 Tax=Bosea sp. WAO TaxID=406341 RepID=UPI000748972E|nr:phosphotransferase [Bosea sp. WAO]KUL93820.1 aminoglycoside phosphotransferase [Bosea sp. WAO]
MAQIPAETVSDFLRVTGLVDDPTRARLMPLTGGVASDIWKVESENGRRVFVVKKALAQLRVAQTWLAPVSRNASEVEWLKAAGRILPDVVPDILASDAEAGIFAMSYLDPADHPVWKQELRAGRADPAFAARLGAVIAAIHAGTHGSAEIARRFANDDTFHSIRIEPYLEATARVHSDLAAPLMALAGETLAAKVALVHGDISPKNILVGPKGPVILDAECAWYGEPAFDLAFCLNHLLLKCLWTPSASAGFLACFDALAENYLAGVDWEPRAAIEARVARLLPALFLARVDGKSPAEYITAEADKDRIRRVARPLIVKPVARLAAIRQLWTEEISR